MTATDATAATDLDAAMTTIAELAEEIGPRRPTGAGEEAAAAALIDRLGAAGIDAAAERFDGYSTFAAPFGLILAAAAAPSLLPRSRPVLRSALSWLAAAGLITEGSLRWAPLSALLSRRPSRNVVATIEPAGEAARTVCLVAHMDTSRSGLIFAPGLVRFMPAWIAASGGLVLLQALLEPFAVRLPPCQRACRRRSRWAGGEPRAARRAGDPRRRRSRRQRQRLRLRRSRRARLETRRRTARIDPRRGADHRLRGGGNARRPRLSRFPRHRWLDVPQLRQRRRPRQRPVPAPGGRHRQVGRRSGAGRRGRSGRDRPAGPADEAGGSPGRPHLRQQPDPRRRRAGADDQQPGRLHPRPASRERRLRQRRSRTGSGARSKRAPSCSPRSTAALPTEVRSARAGGAAAGGPVPLAAGTTRRAGGLPSLLEPGPGPAAAAPPATGRSGAWPFAALEPVLAERQQIDRQIDAVGDPIDRRDPDLEAGPLPAGSLVHVCRRSHRERR